MPELIFSKGGQSLLRFPLDSTSTRIGRSGDCEITLTEDQISREQIAIYFVEGIYLLKNIGKAPLYYDSKPIQSKPLKPSDRFHLFDWEILFSTENTEENFDETYVSVAGEGTQVMELAQANGKCISSFFEFLIQEPGKNSRTFRLSQEVTTVGKKRSCDLLLEDSFCSEVHAKIILRQGKIRVLDLGSTNGTFINGVKIKEAELEDDARLKLGQTELSLNQVLKEEKIRPLEVSSFGPMVGKSNAMRELYAMIQRVAATEATACVLGETGVGKELVARAVHDLSGRRLKPFVALNCGAISRELIESELFGHEKGSFTGAQQQHHGVFEQANGGTLFLDEMGELPLHLQPSLLRVLETGKIRRVGGTQEIPVNVRIVCATHRDLTQAVREGRFREDLFFRLYVFPLLIPALRERREDISLIAAHFVKQMSPPGKSLQLAASANSFLEIQNWPGNVRELKNVIQRAVVLCAGDLIQAEDLKSFGFASATSSSNPVPSSASLQEMEKQAILRELKSNGNNRTAAARALGIAKSTLYEKLRLYEIS
ncbi:MAG: sigma 54-interacting transcriptional regulator [Deltaproteobacteria bacterium]|nr:sigma 54-interacting transcriptional regulator [Deltaproteobacteria bacterium]